MLTAIDDRDIEEIRRLSAALTDPGLQVHFEAVANVGHVLGAESHGTCSQIDAEDGAVVWHISDFLLCIEGESHLAARDRALKDGWYCDRPLANRVVKVLLFADDEWLSIAACADADLIVDFSWVRCRLTTCLHSEDYVV